MSVHGPSKSPDVWTKSSLYLCDGVTSLMQFTVGSSTSHTHTHTHTNTHTHTQTQPYSRKIDIKTLQIRFLWFPESVWNAFYRVVINYRNILRNLMTGASSVMKLFIPPSDRRLCRTTTSKLPPERALNRHKFQDTPTKLGRWGSHFPPTLVYDFPARRQ
jgi:hypothetical protein